MTSATIRSGARYHFRHQILMSLTPGTRLGASDVVALIGVGGMGEVYRARDPRLKRDVAIKVLPDDLAADPEQLARFQREAEILASLNHPHIGGVYGLEHHGGAIAIVLEFVEGDTLADRIARGPVPLDEAIGLARQMAEALEAAHDRGVIHRDLKPANIKVRSDGTVKVLDFGLAKLVDASPFHGGDSQPASTTRAAMTRSGVILGTAAYMSPEQAKGEPVDARGDIWALGCVLYEMITGRAAFAQQTITETLARIIEREPAWEALPANTPSTVRRFLQRCVEKDPRNRFHAAADVRIAIEDALVAREDGAQADHWRPVRNMTVVASLAAAAVCLVAAVVMWSTTRRAPDLGSFRLDVNTAPTRDRASFALSPDGKKLVFVALDQEIPRLWLRHLDQTDPQRLVGTEGASLPFWSPDSRSIAFFAEGWLKRLDLTGASPQLLAQARNAMGGSWNHDDVLVYSPNAASPLMTVPANGATTPTVLTRLSPGEVSHRFPSFLPDGNRFLYLALTSAPQDQALYVGSLSKGATNERHRIMAVPSAADYAEGGNLLMVRDGQLVAVPFDLQGATASGDAIPLAREVASDQQRQRGAFSVSASGLVAYRAGTTTSVVTELAWIQRDGRVTTTLPMQGYPALTADGRYIAVSQLSLSRTRSNTDIWMMDAARGTPRQFTFDSAFDISPVWSPDGSRLVFSSNRKGVFDLFEKPVSLAHDERPLLETSDNKFPVDWSPDGRVVLFVGENAVTGDDLCTVSIQEQNRVCLLTENFAESQGQFSPPDGRWLAYRSNESGRWEVYLRPYPGPGSKQRVSRDGGLQPRWRRDGKELFYIAADSRLIAVPIQESPDGASLDVGRPTPLFTARLASPSNQQFGYAVDRTGQRFLMWTGAEPPAATPITVVLNWQQAGRAR